MKEQNVDCTGFEPVTSALSKQRSEPTELTVRGEQKYKLAGKLFKPFILFAGEITDWRGGGGAFPFRGVGYGFCGCRPKSTITGREVLDLTEAVSRKQYHQNLSTESVYFDRTNDYSLLP